MERLCANYTKAKNLFGWEPKFVGLDGFQLGIEETLRWFAEESHLRGYKPELYNLWNTKVFKKLVNSEINY